MQTELVERARRGDREAFGVAAEVGGATGRLASCSEPIRVFFTDAQRGYAVFLYRSDDEPWVPEVYGLEFFNGLLQTVQLTTTDAATRGGSSG